MTIPVRGSSADPEIFRRNVISSMQSLGRKYPDSGCGIRFSSWLVSRNPKPYNSWGNGAAMRVSPVDWTFDTLEDTEKFAEISHNHPKGIKGAQATAGAIFLARTGRTISSKNTAIICRELLIRFVRSTAT